MRSRRSDFRSSTTRPGAINFAQGEFIMLGGMIAASFAAIGLPLALAVVCAILVVALIGLLVAKIAIAPARDADVTTLIIITIGVSMVLRGGVEVTLGKSGRALPPFSGDKPISFAGATILPQSLWVRRDDARRRRRARAVLPAHAAGQRHAGHCLQSARGRTRRRRHAPRAVAELRAFGGLGAIGGVLIAPIANASYDAGVDARAERLRRRDGRRARFGHRRRRRRRRARAAGEPDGRLYFLGLQGRLGLRRRAAYPAGPPARPVRRGLSRGSETMSVADVSHRIRQAAAQSARAPLLVFALALVALPLLLPNAYYFDVAIRIAVNATLAIALNLLIGYTGQISLGHAAFFGLGAYGSAILAGAFAGRRSPRCSPARRRSASLAYIVGRAILRLEGHYLAMATLGLGVIATIALSNEVALTGGPDGMAVADFSVFGWRARRRERSWYWAFAALLIIGDRAGNNLVDSPAGRALRALHGSRDRRAHARRRRQRVQDAGLRAVGDRRGVVGSLYGHYDGFVTPGLAAFPNRCTGDDGGGRRDGVDLGFGARRRAAVAGARAARAFRRLRDDRVRRHSGGDDDLAAARDRAEPGARFGRKATLTMLRVERLSKSFGGVAAVCDVSFSVAKGADPCGDRPQRRRQDDAVQPDHRASARRPPARSGCAARRSRGCRRRALARRGVARTFQNLQVSMNLSAIENVMVGAHLRLNSSLLAAMARWPGLAARDRDGARGGRGTAGLRRLRRLLSTPRLAPCPTAP